MADPKIQKKLADYCNKVIIYWIYIAYLLFALINLSSDTDYSKASFGLLMFN